MIGLINKLRRRTPLGWLQLSHEKSRLLVALSGVAFADILILMQLGFQAALYDSNTRLHKSLQADIVLINPQARYLLRMSSFPRRRLYQAMSVPGVESAEAIYINPANWKNPQNQNENSLLVLGFNPNKPPFDFLKSHPNIEQIKLPDNYLFDRASRGDYKKIISQVEQGKSITTEMERRRIKVVGLYKIGASFGTDGSLMTSDQNFLMLFPRREASSVSIGVINVKTGYDPNQVAEMLKANLPTDVLVLTKQEFIDFEKNYWAKNTAIGFVFGLGVVMGFVVGVIIVYQVLSTDVNDHISEYATLKAMGYRHIYFLGVIFEEAAILALLGFIPGLAVSTGLYSLTRQATNLPLYMSLTRAFMVLLLTFIMCMISGAIAARKLQGAEPADMF